MRTFFQVKLKRNDCVLRVGGERIERVTGRKARGLQMEEIGCQCQTFFSLLSGRRKQTFFSFSDFFPSLLLLSCFSRVRLCATHRRQPTRLPRPWASPGKNTGVGCHFLLQYMKVGSESEVAQSCPTLQDPMDCSPPGSSIHGIFQAKVLEWGAVTFSIQI